MLMIAIDIDPDGDVWQRLYGYIDNEAERQLYLQSLDLPSEEVAIGSKASLAWRHVEGGAESLGALPDHVLMPWST